MNALLTTPRGADTSNHVVVPRLSPLLSQLCRRDHRLRFWRLSEQIESGGGGSGRYCQRQLRTKRYTRRLLSAEGVWKLDFRG